VKARRGRWSDTARTGEHGDGPRERRYGHGGTASANGGRTGDMHVCKSLIPGGSFFPRRRAGQMASFLLLSCYWVFKVV
jgi:hypothetical protein